MLSSILNLIIHYTDLLNILVGVSVSLGWINGVREGGI